MPEILNLKLVNRRLGIPLRAYEAVGIPKSTISQIMNRDIWPVRRNREELQRLIEQVLKDHGATEDDLRVIWGYHPEYQKKKAPQPSYRDKLLNGGVAMLPKVILEKLALRKDPFTNELEGIGDVFDARPHMFVLQKMLDAAKNQKFLGIWGPVGSGKTVIKNVFVEKLAQERNYLISEPLLVEKAKCRPSAIADALIEDLMYARGSITAVGKMRAPRSLEAKNRLVRAILAANARQGRHAVLIIDEAHELPLETLKALKRFHEHQDGFRKLLSIIIIGQEELRDKLAKDYRVREVTARIDLVELKPIGSLLDEYLRWKIERAGGDVTHIFTEAAIREMKRKLNGANPLLINVLASHAIMKGYSTDTFPVNDEIVELAYKEMAS